MNGVLTGKWVRNIALVLLVLIACGWAVREIRSVYDKEKVEQMTATMKTVCVGRFLIDVPSEAQVSFHGTFLSGWDISVYPSETSEQFSLRLAEQQAAFHAAKNQRGNANVESEVAIERNGVQGRIFVFDRHWVRGIKAGNPTEDTFTAVHAYVHKQGTSLDFTAKYLGPEDASELGQLVSQIQPLRENEIPDQPGFCFGQAMILDPLTASQNERVTMFLSLKKHPDFVIALDTAAGLKPDTPLLVRNAKNSVRQEYANRFSTLRSGNRTISDMPGQELAYKANELNGKTTHDFTWESIPDPSNVFQPTLSLEFSTGHAKRPGGKPAGSSLSDDAVLALWDKISSSIRVRPTKIEKQPLVSQESLPPLGTYATAGDACPVTGWWKCSDGNARVSVENDSTQYIRKGVRMPQAVLLPTPTLLQRISRVSPRFESSLPTQWKLVSYDGPAEVTTGSAITGNTNSNSPNPTLPDGEPSGKG